MDRHVQNAQRVAEFLAAHPRVSWVNYPGLPSSPYHALARKYLPKGAGGILSFGVRPADGSSGDAAAAQRAGERFIEAATFMSHLANVGDARTLVIHPASTTHRQLSDAEQRDAGVTPDLVRLSVGLESIDDLLWDLDQALEASRESA
jgi:O-acetylhomoserine (thiol)-lyase